MMIIIIIIMGHEAFICCYFNQEDHDCVGVQIVFTFCSDFSNEMCFCGEFSQKFLGRAGMLEVNPGLRRVGKVKEIPRSPYGLLRRNYFIFIHHSLPFVGGNSV
jgi:uncharacterized cysteine cluster protein YcgN (CxxCxxCC family)